MVVIFPGTKDQSWRWQTTNADYGRFYLALSSEALGARCRQDGFHAECNKKCEALSRQLYELKAELERLRIGGRLHSPRDGCRSPANHNGDCNYATMARAPCDDAFHTTHDIDYNGGCRTEPQILEDHLKADHPRLVRKVQAVNPLGNLCSRKEPGSEQKIYGRGPISAYWTKGGATQDGGTDIEHRSTGSGTADSGLAGHHYDSRTPDSGGGSYGSAGGGGNRVQHSPRGRDTPPRGRDTPRGRETVSDAGGATGRLVPKGAIKRAGTAPKERTGGASGRGGPGNRNHYGDGGGSYPPSQGGSEHHYAATREKDIPRYVPHTSLKASGPHKKVLPPSQRYNFYRYYGFAGQGAKTSRGWNPK